MHPFSTKALSQSKEAVKRFGADSFCERTDEVMKVEGLIEAFEALPFEEKKQVVTEVMAWQHGWALAGVLVAEDSPTLEDYQWAELDLLMHPQLTNKPKPIKMGLR